MNELDKLLAYFKENEYDSADLDGLVESVSLDVADEVNREGVESQLEYLLMVGEYKEEDIINYLEGLFN